MKKIIVAGLFVGLLGGCSFTKNPVVRPVEYTGSMGEIEKLNENIKNVREVKDILELQNLVYTFSTLSDTKEVEDQVLLFTPEATVSSYQEGKLTSSYTGRADIAAAFKRFLNLFETVYHINGQQTVNVDPSGTTARGINYCQVVLISNDQGKKIARISGVRYSDEYKKVDGKWYISNRKSNFMWTRTEEIK